MDGNTIQITLSQSRDCVDYLIWISSIVVPVFVMFFTLHHSKKTQEETDRISSLPMFSLHELKGYVEKNGPGKGKHMLDIVLKNIGNGTAVSMANAWIKISDRNAWFPTFESPEAIYQVSKTFEMDSTVVPVGGCTNTILVRHSKTTQEVLQKNDTYKSDILVLEISYADILKHKYIQKIGVAFFYDESSGEVVIKECIPTIPEIVR